MFQQQIWRLTPVILVSLFTATSAPVMAQISPSSEAIPSLENISPQAAYSLGVGDRIRVDIFDVPEFSGDNGTYTIAIDGSVTFPWIGKVALSGMTIDEATHTLTQQYVPYINQPLITVTLLSARPMRIGVLGQVNRPGAYLVNAGNGTALQQQTVTQSIQAAGGITQMADVRGIEVHRPQASGSTEIIRVNLWNFLQQGELQQDITLRDGDTVIVPTATALNPAEASELAIANISPATINVNVVGEVVKPGVVTVPPNTTLNQAILAAGGFDNQRARQNHVDLIRLNPDGTVTKRTITVDLSAGLNEQSNPALRSNDIVLVGRSNLATASDFLGTLLSPLTGLFGIFRLLGF